MVVEFFITIPMLSARNAQMVNIHGMRRWEGVEVTKLP